eukprot:3944190-Karenia_brevis.AAC.1
MQELQTHPPLNLDDPADADALIALDLDNAYGRAKRSTCIRGCMRHVPQLAARAAVQWSAATVVWQRCGGTWRKSYSRRGGWQGA